MMPTSESPYVNPADLNDHEQRQYYSREAIALLHAYLNAGYNGRNINLNTVTWAIGYLKELRSEGFYASLDYDIQTSLDEHIESSEHQMLADFRSMSDRPSIYHMPTPKPRPVMRVVGGGLF